MENNLAVLVISCDKYEDAWYPFFSLFFKSWRNCPYKVYLVSNRKNYPDDRVVTIKVGNDSSWADTVRKAVQQIKEDYVLTFGDDFFISGTIDSSCVTEALSLMIEYDVACFRLKTRGKCTKRFLDKENIYYILPKDEYCINTGVAVWRKATYLDFLKPGFSAWDFEVKNSEECNKDNRMPGLFITYRKFDLKIKNGIWRGKWVPESVRFCERNGINIDTKPRGLMSIDEVAWENTKIVARRIIPNELRLSIKRMLFSLGFGDRFASKY